MRGVTYDWKALEPRLREACATPGGLFRLSEETGIAYSTLTRQVRKLNLRPIAAKRPKSDQIRPAGVYKQNYPYVAPKSGRKAPEGPVVQPKHVKVQVCPSNPDTRFTPDPGHVGLFSKLGPGRYITEET